MVGGRARVARVVPPAETRFGVALSDRGVGERPVSPNRAYDVREIRPAIALRAPGAHPADAARLLPLGACVTCPKSCPKRYGPVRFGALACEEQ